MTLVFLSAVGQDDNLGDSLLRREFLDSMRHHGELHILLRGCSPVYTSGLALRSDDVVYTEGWRWWAAAFRYAVRGRILLAFNAGEMQANPRFARSYLQHLVLYFVARARGGRAIHVGMGMRAYVPVWSRIIGLLLAPLSVVTWRDAASRSWTGVGRVLPDWAFASGSSEGPVERNTLAVSVRGDRTPPSAEWIAAIVGFARAERLDLRVVSQVGRDNALAVTLAKQLGVGHDGIVLMDGNHDEAELAIRATYRGARYIVSDRLHALILGAVEGAAPVIFADSPSEKCCRTLATVGLTGIALDTKESTKLYRVAERSREMLPTAMVRARSDLDALKRDIAAVVRSGTIPAGAAR